MNEEANSPDSDDSFGFARRKSNFMDVRHNVRGGGTALLHSGDKKKRNTKTKICLGLLQILLLIHVMVDENPSHWL